jgi:hypothetical protein
MRVTLKKIEYSAFASQETECFRAIVCIDGEPMGTASNAGHGGPTLINPPRLRELLGEHVKGMPPRAYPAHFDMPAYSMPVDAEMIVHDLLGDHLTLAEMRKRLRTKIVYTRPGMAGIWETKHLKPVSMAYYSANRDIARDKLKADAILNFLPEKQALAIFRREG